MARIGRRTFLKLTGTGAIAARTGGMAAILASNRAPAYAQTSTVHWLRFGTTLYPRLTSSCERKSFPPARRPWASSSRLRPLTATTSRRERPLQSNPDPDRTSFVASTIGHNFMPRASWTSATSQKKSARHRRF